MASVHPSIEFLRKIPMDSEFYWDTINEMICSGDLEVLFALLAEAQRIIDYLKPFTLEKKQKKIYPSNKQPSEDRYNINPSLRYYVLKRDNYHCLICGRGAEDQVKLQVDHIKPFSKGGKTNEYNLRTLCFECNIGKSNQYDESEDR